jgi:hypothetical protein
MKIYVVRDKNYEQTVFFTTKKAAEKYYKSATEGWLEPPDVYEIPLTKKGIIFAVKLGADLGGNQDGVNFEC